MEMRPAFCGATVLTALPGALSRQDFKDAHEISSDSGALQRQPLRSPLYDEDAALRPCHNNGWTGISATTSASALMEWFTPRPVERMGSHALGYNAHSIGICYEGGLSPSGCISDTRTPKQKEAMKHLIQDLHHRFPGIRTILGHRDLPGVQKACPCFDATKLQYLLDAS